MKTKHRSFFQNKNCSFCQKQAKTFRLIEHKHYMLCDDNKCDLETRIRAGFFKINMFKK